MNAAAPITWSRDFGMFHARRSVAELKAVLDQAPQQFVVLMRNDDLFYVYRRAELAAGLAGKDPEASVEQAMGMHEGDRSQPMDPTASPGPSRSGEPGAAPSVRRYVHLGPGGMPVAVGEPSSQTVPAPQPGADTPPPTRGRTRGGGLGGLGGFRTSKPQTGADVPATRGRTRGGGAGAPPPMPASEGAPGPAGETASGGTGGAAVPDEGTDIARYPSIAPSGTPKEGESFSITVDLLLEQTDVKTTGGKVTFSKLPADWGEIPIHVQLMSTALDCSPAGGGTIYVRRNGPSLPCTFSCNLIKGVDAKGPIEVIATFMHDGRFCGLARRTIGPEGDTAADPGRPVAGAADRTPASGTQGRVSIEMEVPSPDLTVKIFHPEYSAAGCFSWIVTPRVRFDGLPGRLDGSIQLESSAQEYARELFARFSELTPGDHMGEFEGVGETLWERTPAFFRETYWAARDQFGRGFSIQFISDDPWIPWELMRPVRKGEAANLLVVDHPVARWIAHYDGDLRNKLPGGRIVTVAPKYRSVADQLPSAQDESKHLVDRFSALRVDGTRSDVRRVLSDGLTNEAVAVIHFAGHGQYGLKFADASRIVLEDGDLSVNEVGNASVKLGEKDRTLVVFNACEVGAVGSVLSMVGGWAEAFTRRKFSGFLAPLWPVDDDAAVTVISELLDAVWTGKQPVGDSLRAIREKHGNKSPTFLSYLFYGDVTARVVDAA